VDGDTNIVGGQLVLGPGRLQIAGLSEAGTADITRSSGLLSVALAEETARADVSIADGAQIIAFGPDESVNITAHNLTVKGRSPEDSELQSGILVGAFSEDALPFQVGDINIDADSSIQLLDGSIYNNVGSGAIGDAGNINIKAQSLYLTDSAQIATIVQGNGNGGDLNVSVTQSIEIEGKDSLSSIISRGSTLWLKAYCR